MSADDRMLEYRSFGWNSAQVLSLMPFLEKGLTFHIARRFSQSRFFEWIARYGITFAAGVPTVINMLLAKTGPRCAEGAKLRLMSCSSAPCRGAMAAFRRDVRDKAVADVWHVGSRLAVRQSA